LEEQGVKFEPLLAEIKATGKKTITENSSKLRNQVFDINDKKREHLGSDAFFCAKERFLCPMVQFESRRSRA
jgi:hypothetical protein